MLGRVPLGQPPSLRHLRGRCSDLVRWLRRYYGAVRLPVVVHLWLWAFALPIAARGSSRLGRQPDLPVLAHGGSTHARGLADRAESNSSSRSRCCLCCLPLGRTASALRTTLISRLNALPACAPADASPASLRVPTHGLGSPWVASPSAYGSFIRSSMPVYPGALSPHAPLIHSHLHRRCRDRSTEASTTPLLRLLTYKNSEKARLTWMGKSNCR